ncbi:unnamed protein product [[Candida] boidinii]|nr:unnamed protein product [[Candida] boidinii]
MDDMLKQKMQSPTRKHSTITTTLPRGALDNHFVGPDKDHLYLCLFNECGKTFTRISNIRAHIQTHLSDRPFSCDVCGKKFVRNHDLKRHYRGHQEFTCVCPCGKKFPRKDALKRHRLRMICVGGIPDEKGIIKKKSINGLPVKRGRPKRKDTASVNDRLLKDINDKKRQKLDKSDNSKVQV